MILHLREGDKMDQRAAIRRLTEMQYDRNDMDFTWSLSPRGEVLDIFRPSMPRRRCASPSSTTRSSSCAVRSAHRAHQAEDRALHRVPRFALRGAALQRAEGGGQDQDELVQQKQFSSTR